MFKVLKKSRASGKELESLLKYDEYSRKCLTDNCLEGYTPQVLKKTIKKMLGQLNAEYKGLKFVKFMLNVALRKKIAAEYQCTKWKLMFGYNDKVLEQMEFN